MRLESISRRVRQRFYYSVPVAGEMVGLGRTESYRAAEQGQIPTTRIGKFLLVPRKPWDRTVKRLLGGTKPAREAAANITSAAKSAAAEVTTT